MGKKLKIGVFGGARGNTMIQVLYNHPDAEVVAVCDKYQPLLDSVKAAAQSHGVDVACYTDFDSFINHDMDAVVLANYATEHATYAIRCLHAGKHVLSEVLPSETMAQAVALVETVEETGLVYAYAENYCYMENTFEMWRRYQLGDIGDIQYADCNYIHDCSAGWAGITYGERNHWRNHLCPTFYCTHSLGPIMTISGHRPVQVVGFENPPIPSFYDLGHVGGHASGIEMVTLDNGAIVHSIHGPLKREPPLVAYSVYGSKGSMSSVAGGELMCYREGDTLGQGTTEHYQPKKFLALDDAGKSGIDSHGGSDFYPTHCFIEKILGRPDGNWSIGVHQAVDMGICGILAFRSILNGNRPIRVPDLRERADRDLWRDDNVCTNPTVAGDAVVPCSSYGEKVVSDEVYSEMRRKWLGK